MAGTNQYVTEILNIQSVTDVTDVKSGDGSKHNTYYKSHGNACNIRPTFVKVSRERMQCRLMVASRPFGGVRTTNVGARSHGSEGGFTRPRTWELVHCVTQCASRFSLLCARHFLVNPVHTH